MDNWKGLPSFEHRKHQGATSQPHLPPCLPDLYFNHFSSSPHLETMSLMQACCVNPAVVVSVEISRTEVIKYKKHNSSDWVETAILWDFIYKRHYISKCTRSWCTPSCILCFICGYCNKGLLIDPAHTKLRYSVTCVNAVSVIFFLSWSCLPGGAGDQLHHSPCPWL